MHFKLLWSCSLAGLLFGCDLQLLGWSGAEWGWVGMVWGGWVGAGQDGDGVGWDGVGWGGWCGDGVGWGGVGFATHFGVISRVIYGYKWDRELRI